MNLEQNRQDILSVNEPKFFINDNKITGNKIVEMSTTEQPCLNYEDEYGNTLDFRGGVRKYRKAAKEGEASAQCLIGKMYFTGYGVQQDYAEAVKWYRKAAEQGRAQAQYNLGVR